MSGQLCLFKFERPLVERFGLDFFRAVPKQPGVYVFVGPRGRVLYVGQSKNLRERLDYYKNARPEREPRRIIRLVHETQRIEIWRCETAESAQLREIEWIRRKRPKFNRALASSRAYTFFGLESATGRVALNLAFAREAEGSLTFFGAFKNRGLCRRAFLSMGRILWAERAGPATAYDLPMWMHERSRAVRWELETEAEEEVRGLLTGNSEAFLERTERVVNSCREPFLKKIFENDWLVLVDFQALAERMRLLRDFSGKGWLEQDEVDALQLRRRLGTQA